MCQTPRFASRLWTLGLDCSMWRLEAPELYGHVHITLHESIALLALKLTLPTSHFPLSRLLLFELVE